MESFNMVLEKHEAKPEEIRNKQDSIFAEILVDPVKKKEAEDLEEKWYNESDENNSGVLNFE
jgi:hypothetical protein